MKRVYRVYKKTVSLVDETAAGMYQNLAGNKTGFLLESYDKSYDRFTVFGVNPEEIVRSNGQSLEILYADGRIRRKEGNPLELLKEYYSEFEIRKEAGDAGFSGGLVGNLGYDFIRYTEQVPDKNPDEIGIDSIQMMWVKECIVADLLAETITAVVLEEDSGEGKARALEKAEKLLHAVRAKPEEEKLFEPDGRIVNTSDTPEEYIQKVRKIKQYIKEGHVFQTVLSQRWTVETGLSGFEIYRKLRRLNPSPYLYYFNYGSFEVIGSSPEMIVKKQGDRMYTCPIAGTRKRGQDDAQDDRLKRELLADEKERAEHVMLVDLARNDMGKVSAFGSVKVTEFMDVKKFSHVMHLVSKVEGRRQKELHPLDLAASFLPAGTLSGAPKIRAMEIIDELEKVKRGLYGGATGYIDFSGDMDFCITIRTMVKRNGTVYLQAGAGIVADSVPEREYEECCHKVMALASTLIPDGVRIRNQEVCK